MSSTEALQSMCLVRPYTVSSLVAALGQRSIAFARRDMPKMQIACEFTLRMITLAETAELLELVDFLSLKTLRIDSLEGFTRGRYGIFGVGLLRLMTSYRPH